VGPDGVVQATLERSVLRTVQTPQVFRGAALRDAHATVAHSAPAPDDASLVEEAGYKVVVIDWPDDNPKVTFAGDLERLRTPG
jgi:2-C-methyl-D-erythritol 4-phosphate cytidylyltransferase